MSKLCLENVQFLSESNLDGFDFILDEFANEYNYLESINEASISDTVNKAITKLKELWKSFVELIKDTVRKIKIKAVQMLAKLKLKKKEEQKKESENKDNSSENETNNSNVKLLGPAKTLEDKEKERRERKKTYDAPNTEVIPLGSITQTTLYLPEFFAKVKQDKDFAEMGYAAEYMYEDGFNTCIDKVKKNMKNTIGVDKEYEYVFANDFEILRYLFHTTDKYFDIMDKDITKQTIRGVTSKIIGEKVPMKVSFNNKNGFDIERILGLMISDLSYFDMTMNVANNKFNKLEKEINDYYDKNDDLKTSSMIEAISEARRILLVLKDSINGLLGCHVRVLEGCFTISKRMGTYKYATFELANEK